MKRIIDVAYMHQAVYYDGTIESIDSIEQLIQQIPGPHPPIYPPNQPDANGDLPIAQLDGIILCKNCWIVLQSIDDTKYVLHKHVLGGQRYMFYTFDDASFRKRFKIVNDDNTLSDF